MNNFWWGFLSGFFAAVIASFFVMVYGLNYLIMGGKNDGGD